MSRTERRIAPPRSNAPAAAVPSPPQSWSPATRMWLAAGLVLTLIALLWHSWAYRFLTDDAFISFRYAHNLAAGHGLVFNPGFERVEGYSNFLWVLILAAFDSLGLAPERVANPLSLACTVALWGLVARAAVRAARSGPAWTALLAPAWLAITRSIAVWSTSGLETRAFELLVVAGLLRLTTELDEAREANPPRWVSPWLLGLAALTRPDGQLIAVGALAAAFVVLRMRAPASLRDFARGLLPFVLLVGGHLVFRRVYYGAWVPNTYFAKVGGRLDVASGLAYVTTFALEYGALLWPIPLLLGVVWHVRRGSGHVPLVLGAALLPYLGYVIAIGGDHFEFRPLDLLFAPALLLMADGLRGISSPHTARTAAVAALALLVGAGLWVRPWQTHEQFPAAYHAGFPGTPEYVHGVAADYLAPERDGVYGLPGLRGLAAAHRRLLFALTHDYVGLRQEEHRGFLETSLSEGQRIRSLIERGLLPRDVYIAMSCVGAMPYVSGVRTLDRHGLTDAHVSHQPFSANPLMAHGKFATLDYARSRGVDLWTVDKAYLTVDATSENALTLIRRTAINHENYYVADVGGGALLMSEFPQGLEAARRRMPRLAFRRLDDPGFAEEFVGLSIPMYLDSARAHPDDMALLARLAFIARIGRRWGVARDASAAMLRVLPATPELLEQLATADEQLGLEPEAVPLLAEAARLAVAAGNTELARQIEARRARDAASRAEPTR